MNGIAGLYYFESSAELYAGFPVYFYCCGVLYRRCTFAVGYWYHDDHIGGDYFLLFLYLSDILECDLSVGFNLAVGMMIDNEIIVTENVSQYRDRGLSLKRAAVAGTTGVITPMLSSSLTTIAVFVPLVFMSGIAGAVSWMRRFLSRPD